MNHLGLHGRIALWDSLLIALAFLVFGFQTATLVFAGVSLIVLAYVFNQIRSQAIEPLSEISDSVGRAAAGHKLQLPISRGGTEIRELVGHLERWSQHTETRIQELSDSRLRFETILSAMGEGVLVFDSEHRIILANDALVELLRLPRNVVGQTCLEVFRDELLDRFVQEVLEGEPPEAIEIQTDGGRTMRALLSPIRGESGSDVEAVVSVLHDVTDIRQIDHVRRDFVANVSHEFKTPLTSIRGYAETMLAGAEGAQEKDFVDAIYRNARYLESLVNDLLDLARLESEPSSSPHWLDIQSVVTEQVMLRRRVHDPLPDIEVDCPSLSLNADRPRLSKALSNLIDNAISYNRPDGKVRICGRREGSDIVIDVSDSGFGIPQEDLQRIFERFYRVDKARARKEGGTGLGLSIARHAIESQGGTLTVESHVGSGSTFTIRLPAAEKGS